MKFYTTANNTRNKEVGIGSHKGQNVHVRTWDQGVRVISALEEDGTTIFLIYQTSGSDGSGSDQLLGTLKNGKFRKAIKVK